MLKKAQLDNFYTIKNFLNDSNEPGLHVLDSFTGTGKTHNIVEHLFSLIGGNKLCYYITPRITNLDEVEEKILSLNGGSNGFLRVRSNLDSILSLNLYEMDKLSHIINKICTLFDVSNNDLIESIGRIKNLYNRNTGYHELSTQIRALYGCLNSVFYNNNYNLIYDELADDEVEFFERIFYPSLLIRRGKVKVVLISTRKALSGMVEPYGIWMPLYFERNCQFLFDESDAQYVDMIDFLSERAQYNLYAHIRQICSQLTLLDGIPEKGHYYSYGEPFNSILARFKRDHLYPFIKKYNPFLTLSQEMPDPITMLIDEEHNHTIKNELKLKVAENYKNVICGDGEIPLEDFINDSHKLIDVHFSTMLTDFLQSIIIHKQRANEKHIKFREIFDTILQDMGLFVSQDRFNSTSLYSRILDITRNGNLKNKMSSENYNPKTFKLTSIKRDYTGTAELNSIFVPYSPNHIISRLSQTCSIVFSSATSTNGSVVGNFDLNYLASFMSRNKLKYRVFSTIGKDFINVNFSLHKDSYNSLLVSSVSGDNYHIIDSMSARERSLLVNGSMNTFYKKRAQASLNAIDKYIAGEHKYGIFFVPKHYNKEMITLLNSMYEGVEFFSVDAIFLKSGGLNKILDNFSSNPNYRAILITHYSTLSSGVNLQRSNNGHKYDADFMFLDLPTNLFLEFSSNTTSVIIRNIFHLKALYSQGSISEHEYLSSINLITGGVNPTKVMILNKGYKKTYDYKLHLWKILQQSIGRLSRTRHKLNTHIVINYDLIKQFEGLSKYSINSQSYESHTVFEYIYSKLSKQN